MICAVLIEKYTTLPSPNYFLGCVSSEIYVARYKYGSSGLLQISSWLKFFYLILLLLLSHVVIVLM